RSAALQTLGEIIVCGRDPPDALAALLDSLRNASHAFRGEPTPLGVAGGGGAGSSSNSSSSNEGIGSSLVDRVMGSMSLWTRRLKTRSDERDEPLVSGVATEAARTQMPESEEEEEEEEEEESDSGVVDSAARMAAPARALTLFGECLEVAAVKVLAAPGEPLPVRFFASLAAAAASGEVNERIVPGADASTSGGAGSAAESDAAATVAPQTMASSSSDASAAAVAAAATAAAVEATTAAGRAGQNEGQAGIRKRSAAVARRWRRRQRRPFCGGTTTSSTLAGVLDLVLGRMSGQTRLSEELLGSESEQASEMVRTLLFSRLTPLLILNALPAAALALEDAKDQEWRLECQNIPPPPEFHDDDNGASSGDGVDVLTRTRGTLGLSATVRRGGVLEEISCLLLERTERLYEYDQVEK
ncbi:unnamed protein product, partial [Hapterophycus canaliculatus]